MYAQREIINKFFSKLDDASKKLNNFNKENGFLMDYSAFGAKKIDLLENSIIYSEEAFKKTSQNTRATAYNTTLSPSFRDSINVYNTKHFSLDTIIHEAIHDASTNFYYSSGFKKISNNKSINIGINEGATQYLAIKSSGMSTPTGYDPIVEVYNAIEGALEANGHNGIGSIGSAYYNNSDTRLFQNTFGKIFDDFEEAAKLWNAFKKYSDRVATTDNSLISKDASNKLFEIANKITEAGIKKAVGGVN